MANKGFRKLIDSDGQEYVFSCEKFNTAISRFQNKSQPQNNRKITKENIYLDLSKKINVSAATIKNWVHGKHGTSLEVIKDISEYMQIDYHELLETDEAYLQPSPTKEQDRKLVEEVFKKSLEVIVRKINFVPEDTEISIPVQHINNRERAIRELRNIHLYVNCHALSTSETIRNSLHRVLLDTEEIIHGHQPESWERFNWSEEEMDERKSALRYSYSVDREGNKTYELDADMFRGNYYGCERKDLFWDYFSSHYYLFDEIEYATDLGLDDVRNIDDEFYEIDSSNGEAYEKYGYHGFLDINPTMVFEHVLTKYLSSVYKIVFEDLF